MILLTLVIVLLEIIPQIRLQILKQAHFCLGLIPWLKLQSQFYVSENGNEDDDNADVPVSNVWNMQSMKTEFEQMKSDLLALKQHVESLEAEHRQVIDSILNSEAALRESVEAVLDKLQDSFRQSRINQEGSVDCLLWRDAKWENQIKAVR